MPRLALVVVALITVNGCYQDNPESCQNPMPSHPELCMSIGSPCANNNECMSRNSLLPVCDLTGGAGTCVQCTASDHAQCKDMMPRCEVHTCVACVDDNDCGGTGVCLQTGDCADTARIIHAVSSGGSDQPTCGATGSACTLDRALLVVAGNKNIIRLDDAGPYTPSMNSFVVSIDVTIDARPAVLHNNNNDNPILKINGNRTATILGGLIEGAHGNGGSGLRCDPNARLTVDGTSIAGNDESAIDASNCTLTVTHAQLSGNSRKAAAFFPSINIVGGSLTLSRSSLTSNTGGGVLVGANTKFIVVGNAFLNNGTIMSPTGAVSISTSQDSRNRLEFNTISANNSQAGSAAGIHCSAGSFVARNNIVWNNFVGFEIDGGCAHAYSDVGPVPGTFTDMGHIINMNPLLVSEAANPHLQALSPVKGQADPAADLTGVAEKDIDGQVRVMPADLGADQMQ